MSSQHSSDLQVITQQLAKIQDNPEPQLAWVLPRPHQNACLHIFSGSFNPLSTAHVALLETAGHSAPAHDSMLLLATANVDKAVFGLTLAERLLILQHYAQHRDTWSVAACSHGRFIEKLHAIKTARPEYEEYVFIVGYDTLIRIFEPRYYDDFQQSLDTLFSQCRFIAATRQHHDLATMQGLLQRADVKPYAAHVSLVELLSAYRDISSTQIRTRLTQNQSIRGLIPTEVYQLTLELSQQHDADA